MLNKLHETLRSNHPTIVLNHLNIIQFKTTLLLYYIYFPVVPAVDNNDDDDGMNTHVLLLQSQLTVFGHTGPQQMSLSH